MEVRQFLTAVDGGKRQFALASDLQEFQSTVGAAKHAFEQGYVQSLVTDRDTSAAVPFVNRLRVGSLTDAGRLYLDWE
jgi:hypothetical protein